MKYLCIIVPVILCSILTAMQLCMMRRPDNFGINSGYYLSGDGSWAGQMQPAAASADGSTGLVPAPLTGQQNAYLRGDGKWIQANNAPTAAQYLHMANTTGGIYEKDMSIALNTQVAMAAGTTAITYSAVTKSFTLQAGYSYKLSAGVNWATTPGVYQWYSIGGTTPGYIGTGGNTALIGNQTAASVAVAYITPTVTTSVALYSQQWTIVLPVNTTALCAWAIIEVVSNNTAISQFAGATSAAAGAIGYIPSPLAGQQNYVLTGAGSWTPFSNCFSPVTAGTVINYAGTTAPAGYLVCNGGLISRATYADLFAAIGTLYGAGNGTTTFAVPDLRGQFIRGLDSGANVDAGRVLGSAQADSLQQHGHVLYRGDGGGYEGPQVRSDDDNSLGGLIKVNGGFGMTYIREIFPGDVGGSVARISGETRPKNVAMIMCIKT